MTGETNQGIIELIKLGKKYRGFPALSGVTLSILEGETFVFLGPNGSGKSTVLKIICGLVNPTEGNALILGSKAFNLTNSQKRNISFLPQRTLFPPSLTVREILSFYAALRGVPNSRIEDVTALVGLNEKATQEKFISELSGGMTQRLALAVTCLADAQVFLLDEPTASLDPEGVLLFRSLVKKLKERRKTVIITTHLLDDALELADRIAVLVAGELRCLINVEELRSRIEERSILRVHFSSISQDALDMACSFGAALLEVGEDFCRFLCSPGQRLRVLQALQAFHTEVTEFFVEQPSREETFLKLSGLSSENLSKLLSSAGFLIEFPKPRASAKPENDKGSRSKSVKPLTNKEANR